MICFWVVGCGIVVLGGFEVLSSMNRYNMVYVFGS